jgi:hypothetical protein
VKNVILGGSGTPSFLVSVFSGLLDIFALGMVPQRFSIERVGRRCSNRFGE